MTEGNDKTTPSYPQCVDSRPVDRPGWEALVRTADENSRRDRKTKLGNKGAWRAKNRGKLGEQSIRLPPINAGNLAHRRPLWGELPYPQTRPSDARQNDT